MTITVYLAICAGVLIFSAGCIWRISKYMGAPLHLRWELYPVPHEEPRRAVYGGSYFESAEWWRQPQEHHHSKEWSAMFLEIVFLKSLRDFNRRLWIQSFLFHFGLYLSIGAAVLMAGGTLLERLVPGLVLGRLTAVSAWIGLAGAVLVLAGAFLLLVRRLVNPAVKNYTKAADIFNLFFFIVSFTLLLVGYLAHSPHSASVSQIARGFFHFERDVHIDSCFGCGLILVSALAAWIPFTRMSHFVGKYFTWHSVRWDDRRMEPGDDIERTVGGYLNLRPTWTGPHIGADGTKTWAEIASSSPEQGAGK